MRTPRTRRSEVGFTLVELLVVIAIIGLLLAVLLPAVQAARSAARRGLCTNNLRQLALGIINFESANGHFPSSWRAAPAIHDGKTSGWSAHVQILPFIEQNSLYQQIDMSDQYGKAKLPSGQAVGSVRVPTFLCPSEPGDRVRLSGDTPKHYPLNYAVNVGVWFVYNPVTKQGGKGAFYPRSTLSAKSFEGGLSRTVAMAEVKAWNPYYRNAGKFNPGLPSPQGLCSLGGQFKQNSGHTEWVDGRAHQTGVTATYPPNTKVTCSEEEETYDVDWTNQQEGISRDIATYAAVTSRSHHANGVNITRMDASSSFVTDEIDVDVWRAMFTRSSDALRVEQLLQ